MIANINDDAADDDGDDDKDYNMGDNPDDGDDDYGLRLMMMMTTTPMPLELSAMMTQTSCDNNDGRHHQLMVLRFRSTLKGLGDDSSFSMAACVCNAIQEPGIVNNSSMPLFGNPHNRVPPESRFMEEMTLSNALHAAARIGGLGGNPMSQQLLNTDTVRYVDGVPHESQAFLNDMPPYFFIIGKLQWVSNDGNLGHVDRVFPSIFKEGNYYICSGRESSRVLKIADPISTFFTAGGRALLEIKLSRTYANNENDRCSFPRVSLLSKGMLCIPTVFHHGPSNWDNLR